ncbi:hypothetical protein EV363DRAFT_319283 [Boletus edulis]|nr:hypothetical protein EV363DRAFT_319283 [Boletus edulis]
MFFSPVLSRTIRSQLHHGRCKVLSSVPLDLPRTPFARHSTASRARCPGSKWSRCRSIRREWWWPSRLVDYDQRTLSLVSSAYGCAPDLPSILTRVLEVLIPCVSISQKSWYRQFMSDRYRSITRSVTPLDRFISCVPYTAYPRSTSVFTTLVCFIRWRFSRGTFTTRMHSIYIRL